MTASSELTYRGLLLGIFAQQVGLPIPSIVFLVLAGALAAHGKMSVGIVVCLGILGCLAGDAIWFWVGRKWGSNAARVLCRFTADPRSCSRNARERFRRYGLPLWATAYSSLGYFFANERDIAARRIQDFGTALGLLIAVPVALYAGWRGLTLARTIRHLRLRRISSPMFAQKLKTNSKIAIIDLLNFEEADGQSPEAIPGAFVDPGVLRQSPQITDADDIKVILYCSSGSDAVSAQAAMGLKRIGVDKVWVLEGGLRAWLEHGFPVSRSPEVPEAVAERLDIKLPARVAGSKREINA